MVNGKGYISNAKAPQKCDPHFKAKKAQKNVSTTNGTNCGEWRNGKCRQISFVAYFWQKKEMFHPQTGYPAHNVFA